MKATGRLLFLYIKYKRQKIDYCRKKRVEDLSAEIRGEESRKAWNDDLENLQLTEINKQKLINWDVKSMNVWESSTLEGIFELLIKL